MSTLLLRVFVYVCSLASGALALPLAVAIRDGDAVSARAFAWPLAAGLAAAAAGVLRWRRPAAKIRKKSLRRWKRHTRHSKHSSGWSKENEKACSLSARLS